MVLSVQWQGWDDSEDNGGLGSKGMPCVLCRYRGAMDDLQHQLPCPKRNPHSHLCVWPPYTGGKAVDMGLHLNAKQPIFSYLAADGGFQHHLEGVR
ncbi:hypothetical protein OIU85_017844, partial [Salix viminalis]